MINGISWLKSMKNHTCEWDYWQKNLNPAAPLVFEISRIFKIENNLWKETAGRKSTHILSSAFSMATSKFSHVQFNLLFGMCTPKSVGQKIELLNQQSIFKMVQYCRIKSIKMTAKGRHTRNQTVKVRRSYKRLKKTTSAAFYRQSLRFLKFDFNSRSKKSSEINPVSLERIQKGRLKIHGKPYNN